MQTTILGTTGEKNASGEIQASSDVAKKNKKSTIAVIGLGYVGLPLAILAEERGYHVLGFDIDENKIRALKRRSADFLAPEELALFQRSEMRLSNDERILDEADTFIICVPTPVHHDHSPDLLPLQSACTIVGRHLKEEGLVIVESTVNPGACRKVALPILEQISGLLGEIDFYFSHCPERINPGDPNFSVVNIPRVIGALGVESLQKTLTLYRDILGAQILPMQSIEEAEAVKMVENSFRDINIAFINELAMSFAKTGIDITNVIKGASTKPFGFTAFYPGCGVGGHCIPVDPYYLIRYGHENGFEHRFLIAAREINNAMPGYTVDLLNKTLKEDRIPLKGATVALLGLAYKRDIGDLRESPALSIREELIKRGANVRTFDPHVLELSSVDSLEAALSGADAVVVATDHELFKNLSPQTLLRHGVTVVIDGRNCLPKEEFVREGLLYRGIGR